MRTGAAIAAAVTFALPMALAVRTVPTETAVTPIVNAALQPPGTKLGNMFTVPRGARLIGAVFPTYTFGGTQTADHGWRALLLVTGDPRTVVNRFRRQARAAGMEVRSGSNLCSYNDVDPKLFRCFATAVRESPDDPRQLTITGLRGPSEYGPVSHLDVVYDDLGPTNRPSVDQTLTADAELGPKPPPLPKGLDHLAGPGDFLFGTSYKPPKGSAAPPVKVESGTRTAGPVGPAFSSSGFPSFAGGYNWAAVLHITGNTDKVVAAYRRQLQTHGKTFGAVSETFTARPERDVTVYEFSSELVGDWEYQFQLLHGRGGDWMLVTTDAET